jgi:predicted HTH transcriptional regulator
MTWDRNEPHQPGSHLTSGPPLNFTSRRILYACKNQGRFTSGSIMLATGIDRKTVAQKLNDLVNNGKAIRIERGVFRLVGEV